MPHPIQPWLRIHEVFHPSDFSEGSRAAFLHALAVASTAGARLTLLHTTPGEESGTPFPDVLGVLAQWRGPAAEQPPPAEREPELQVRRLRAATDDPIDACLRCLNRTPADLIVLAVQERQGKMAWLRNSQADPLTRKSGEMTLFIPEGAEGFVSPQDGSAALRRILVPLANQPRPEPAIEAARRLMLFTPEAGGVATALHVGVPSEAPEVLLPDVPGWTWHRVVRQGDAVGVILQTAAEVAADVIAMTTEGRNGFLDALRGTTTERVLRKARCPLLAMPVGSFLG